MMKQNLIYNLNQAVSGRYNLHKLLCGLVCLIFFLAWSHVGMAADNLQLTGMSVSSDQSKPLQLTLNFAEPVTSWSDFLMKNPDRLVVDFPPAAIKLENGSLNVNRQGVADVLVVSAATKTRLMIDLATPLTYQIVTSDDKKQVSIIFAAPKGPDNAAQVAGNKPLAQKAPPLSANSASAGEAKITAIDFQTSPSNSQEGDVVVSFNKDNVQTDITNTGNDVEVTFYNAYLPAEFKNIYDATAFATPVQNYRLTPSGAHDVKLTIQTQGNYDQFALQSNKQFIAKILPQTQTEGGGTAGMQQAHYQGQKISLNFQNIPVRSVVQLLAQFTGENIVISDKVTGSVTLKLNDVPWDQALDFILRTQGLGKLETGNVLMIAPAADIAAQQQSDLKAQQAISAVSPLYTQSFQINYGSADNYYQMLKNPAQTLLSPRGKVVELSTTNTLIVEDTQAKLQEIAALFKQMDVPQKQVLIEARIVYVNTTYIDQLGVQWGSVSPGGTPGIIYTGRSGLGPFQDWNMDMAAAGGPGGTPGTLVLGEIIGGQQLDLQLQAFESEGHGEVVSDPKVLTSNNQQATISSGEQIPYQTSAPNGGTTTQFIAALLTLQVTPQITPNNKLMLNLNVTQAKPDTSSNPPGITQRTVTTNVLVNDGQTIVLGGVYETTQAENVNRVPFLSDIPFLGNLFKSTTKTDIKTELLIFLTPKIVDTGANDNK